MRVLFIVILILFSFSGAALGADNASGSVREWDLAGLYDKYVSEDKEIISKKYAIDAAKARLNQSNAQYYPRLSVVSNLNANQTFQPNAFQNLPIFTGSTAVAYPIYYRFNTGLSLQYTIWNGDGRSAGAVKSYYNTQIAELELRKMREEKLYQLALQYYNLARYRLKLSQASSSLAVFDEHLDKLKLKMDSGLVLPTDYEAAYLKKYELELMIRRYNNEIALIISQLDDFVGGSGNSYDTSVVEKSFAQSIIRPELPAASSDNAIDYYTASLSARIAEADEIAASSKLSPNVTFAGNYLWEQNDRNIGNVFSNMYQYWNAAISLDYPIYDGNANGSQLEAARYDNMAKKANSEGVKSNIQKELDNYRKDYAIGYDNYTLMQKSYGLSSRQLRIAELSYQGGKMGLTAYMDAVIAANRSYANMLDARVDLENTGMKYLKSFALLEKRIFGGDK